MLLTSATRERERGKGERGKGGKGERGWAPQQDSNPISANVDMTFEIGSRDSWDGNS